MKKILVIAFLSIMLGACATAGRKFDTTHVNDIKVGKQNKQQIRKQFGEPYRVQTLAGHPKGCTERWFYEYAKAVGFGHVTANEVLVVDFSIKGRVCDHAYNKAK